MISWPGANMHILNTAGVFLLKVNFEYDRRNWNMFKVNSKDGRTKSIDAV